MSIATATGKQARRTQRLNRFAKILLRERLGVFMASIRLINVILVRKFLAGSVDPARLSESNHGVPGSFASQAEKLRRGKYLRDKGPGPKVAANA
jgi:hypothetical protein